MTSISTSVLLIVSLFAIASGILFYGFSLLFVPKHGSLHQRLQALTRSNSSADNFSSESAPSHWIKNAVQYFEAPSKKLYGANKKYLQEVRQLLIAAGKPSGDDAIWKLLAQQLVMGILFGISGIFIGIFYAKTSHLHGTDFLNCGLCGFIGGMLLGRYWPSLKLKNAGKKRQQAIQQTLPDVLDLLVICVESGLGLDAAILRVCKEVDPIAPEMAFELQRTHSELNAGIPRSDAFRHLGARNTVEDLKSLCTLIIQADKLGTSIAESLRTYSQEMRVRRRQRAEELAYKAGVKMMFPLVLFVFPLLFVIIIGPAAIEIFTTMMNM
ncbi:MAG: type II secretion system F family protein [Vampirovibrionales bacterium]